MQLKYFQLKMNKSIQPKRRKGSFGSPTNQVLIAVFEESGLSKVAFATRCDCDIYRMYAYLNDTETIKYQTLEKLMSNYGLRVAIVIERG